MKSFKSVLGSLDGCSGMLEKIRAYFMFVCLEHFIMYLLHTKGIHLSHGHDNT